MFELLSYSFGQRALIAGLLMAVTCASLGVFLVLRRLALISDGLGHVAFGGVALGLYLQVYPLYTAVATVLAGALGIHALRRLRISGDTAIGILFSTGLAIGIVLVGLSHSAGADLLSYLFGTLLGVNEQDLQLTLALALVVLLTLALFFKEWFFITFDIESAQAAGLPVSRLELLFTILTGLTVVIATKVIGLLLVTSLMVVPSISAILLKLDFKRTLLAANVLAILATLAGLEASFAFDLAPGGSIVLASVVLFLGALAYSKFLERPAMPHLRAWAHRD